MREIKFRAWAKTDKEMLINTHDAKYSFHLEENKIAISNEEHFEFMQYTGLKDKNGVEIYEDDILEIYSKVGKTQTKGRVCFEGKVCAFMVDDKIFHQALPITELDDIEIIGNIYENPELLEKN